MKNASAQKEIHLLPGYILLFSWLAFTIILFGWAILASLSTTRDIFANTLLKGGPKFSNYIQIVKNQNMGLYFLNSIIYTISSCFGIIVVSSPAAYILGRAEFFGKKLVNTMFLSAISLPGMLIAIPLFTMFVKLKLTGSVLTLILIYIFTNVPFSVFFLSSFFSSIPKELEESAAIDGCGPIRAFIKIVLPMAQPGIVTLSIFNFLGVWNEYFYALIFANDPQKRPLALALQSIVQGLTNIGDYASIFAATMFVFLPTFVIYLLLSKKIITGITVGSVKG